jgi:RHH-type proline utilization regulon transcriptional repressor/proline dehydrogenase/delta 1-pyrroline-5-carboxylate dehydrogenase
MDTLFRIRAAIRERHFATEADCLAAFEAGAPTPAQCRAAVDRAARLVREVRQKAGVGLMEAFLVRYGLSTDEGLALMSLAEALLRVPDARTVDQLIEDKIIGADWTRHAGRSQSLLVNASTIALALTGKVLDADPDVAGVLRGLLKRAGAPAIRAAVRVAMRQLGNEFVLGQSIEDALVRGRRQEDRGYTYSFDMLGEAALTAADGTRYFEAYRHAIAQIGQRARSSDIRENNGISIKLSALHPRYEVGQRDRVLFELVERTRALALDAKQANIGLNIDAEESARLDLSLDVIEAVLRDERLAGWDGFGVVVQAYGKRAPLVIDWLHALSTELDRKIMVRLVKGAYWDTEIKRSQVENHRSFPVFTRKPATDVSYLFCAAKLLGMTDRIYPQFATHNAHTIAAILELAGDRSAFEFQRLHGMGEVLHRVVREQTGTRCRIYAPVGPHRELLAYLVRRLLENGANSSFVNQLQDSSIAPEAIAADPFAALAGMGDTAGIVMPSALFAPNRVNSQGWDVQCEMDIERFDSERAPFAGAQWTAEPLIRGNAQGSAAKPVINPSLPGDHAGQVVEASPADVDIALEAARAWDVSEADRAATLMRAADLFEENTGAIVALLAREAGKTPADAIAEVREAVDFLRYYACGISRLEGREACGVFACISPWNFPLAIFTGQVAAALAAGNGVLAKPADPTPLIAHLATILLHRAGVPTDVLQLLPGRGSVVGARIVADSRVGGVCFTGSTATARAINRAMVGRVSPHAPLIAETGGLNAMVVDSTALPEQAVRDIVNSAFRSAGQRCSALRILFVQEDIAAGLLDMLFGAMDELKVGDPWHHDTDVGPVINSDALEGIMAHIEKAKAEGRVLKQIAAPTRGTFVGPTVIKVDGMKDMQREVFGPVLHVATFRAGDIASLIQSINQSGYGLTFGLHTRLSARVNQFAEGLDVGNIYVNRNQIGAIVESQPFGGEGLSGTGPKAGGPHYLRRFTKPVGQQYAVRVVSGPVVADSTVQKALDELAEPARAPLSKLCMPGPTGESNTLLLYPRGKVLCLGPDPGDAMEQERLARESGCSTLVVCPGATSEGSIDGFVRREALATLSGFDAVVLWSEAEDLVMVQSALSRRDGLLVSFITDRDVRERCMIERHVSIDTTAAGGNATLLTTAGI